MKKFTRDDLIEGWLLRYHGITIADLIKYYPEECKSGEWFRLFPVTQEQHDEWEEWAIEAISKAKKIPKKRVRKLWGLTYLDCAPMIKED